MRHLAALWSQVWPNLAANIIWAAPLAWLAHRRLRHHGHTIVDRLYDRLMDETEGPDRTDDTPGGPRR